MIWKGMRYIESVWLIMEEGHIVLMIMDVLPCKNFKKEVFDMVD